MSPPTWFQPGLSATFIQNDPFKVPIITAGEITPEVMKQYEHGCLDYFDAKDVPVEKQVSKVTGSFKDSVIRNWMSTNKAEFHKKTFNDYMAALREFLLPPNWDKAVAREVERMSQGNMRFCDFAAMVEYKNSLLINSTLYKKDKELRVRLQGGMSDRLALQCECDPRVCKETDYRIWKAEVSLVDNGIRKTLQEFERIVMQLEDESRGQALDKPSRRANTQRRGGGTSNRTQSARNRPPKMGDEERSVLIDHTGCLKCRRVYQDHIARGCPNGFPPTDHKPITRAEAEAIGRSLNRGKNAIIATVVPVSVLDSDEDEMTPPIHPIAAILGSSGHPVAYIGPNISSVPSDYGEISDNSVSPLHAPAAAVVIDQNDESASPFRTPHLVWHCAVSGHNVSFPVPVEALIDSGSHTVLIHDALMQQLGLRRRKLPQPECIPLAMDTPLTCPVDQVV